MHKHKIVHDLNIVTKRGSVCECCKLNKCLRASHPARSSAQASRAGHVLHIDTAGPSNVVSLSGSRYLVLYKDEATADRKVAFIRNK